MNIQNTKKTQVAIMNAVHDLPVLVARDKGFFNDEGLDLEFVTTPGMAQVTTSHLVKFDSIFDRPLDSVYNEGGIDQYRMCEWGIMKRAVEANATGLRGRKIVALAGGTTKIKAIRSILRSGLLHGLITDEATAHSLANTDPGEQSGSKNGETAAR